MNLMRILIAEDEIISRRVLQSHLTKWGYEVLATTDGEEAWQVLQSDDPPKLAILDWMMPKMDGVEVSRRLRAAKDREYVYILLLTAKGQKEDVIAGLEAGADDYLTKPFDAHELQARVRAGARIIHLQDELIHAREEIRKEATHDGLTGLWNRVAIMDALSRELNRGARSNQCTGILMVDLDHFKSVNDTHGHLAGDAVLREAAQRLVANVRAYDFVGRYGGEEFLAILPDCCLDCAFERADRLRKLIAERPFETKEAVVPVTMSVGVTASLQKGAGDLNALLKAADKALYTAKAGGRNQVRKAEGQFASCKGTGQALQPF